MHTSFERFELAMTLEDAQSASHSGRCDEDVLALSRQPHIAAQLANLDPEKVRDELREYGAWEDGELADHEENLQRVLWLGAGQIVDEPFSGER